MVVDLVYCKICGTTSASADIDKEVCFCCGAKLYEVPKKYTDNFRWRDGDGRQALMEEEVKKSPEFDEALFNARDQILDEKTSISRMAYERGKAIHEGRDKGNSYGVACPYCGATNVKKIAATSRIASVGFFGLGSKKIGKQWHCTKCGSDF